MDTEDTPAMSACFMPSSFMLTESLRVVTAFVGDGEDEFGSKAVVSLA